jgi:T5SS/PEP-CTERM-associated repeat protein
MQLRHAANLGLKLRGMFILLLAFCLPLILHAQFVADGQTFVFDGVATTVSGINVGTNGNFTLLVVTNGARVTNNAGRVVIGVNATALSNHIAISGSGTLLKNNNDTYVGDNGSFNDLEVKDGATVTNSLCYVGHQSLSSNNTVLISDSDSSCKATMLYVGASNGRNNQLIVTNGGTMQCRQSTSIGLGFGANNVVVVTGANSVLTNGGAIHVGDYASNCLFMITNGGTAYSGNLSGLGMTGPASMNNLAVITDAGSSWTSTGTFYVGQNSSGNELDVLNGGKLTVATLSVGAFNAASNRLVLDGGTITVLTNASLNRYATLVLNAGMFTTPSLSIDPSEPRASQIIFRGGTLQSGSTGPLTNSTFVVGDGTNAAVFEMLSQPPNTGLHSFQNGLSISSNATLKGFGTIIANVSVQNGGMIMLGTTNIGTVTIRKSLNLNTGSTTSINLDPAAKASDKLIGISNLFFGGTLQLNNLSGPLAVGDAFKIFGATNYFGAFDALIPASPGDGLRWDTNELNLDGVLRIISAATPAPTFGTIAAANGNLTVIATGGVPYDPCYLLTSTNLTAPLIDWSCIVTNYFNASGSIHFTNTVLSTDSQHYFRLQVN